MTASVAPHHLVLTDAELQTFDSNCKVDPPLRSREHVEALMEGLADGTIEAICSDHRPVPSEEKDLELDAADVEVIEKGKVIDEDEASDGGEEHSE